MRTTLDVYERNALNAPDRDAIVFEGTRLTNAQLLARARQLGSAIEKTGIPRQGIVGIFAANSAAYFEIAAATEIAARIIALFNFRFVPRELTLLVEQAEPEVIFFDAEFAETVRAATEGREEIRRFVCIGDEVPEWATPYEQFVCEGDPDGPVERPTEDDIASLFYTGGTTGLPRGVPYKHSAMLFNGEHMAPAIEDIVVLQIAPAFHVGGRFPVMAAQWFGGTSVIERGFDATRWLDQVSKERVNWTFMVPAMIQGVIDHPELASFDISSLEYVMAASTAIPPNLLARAIDTLGPVFYVAYGSTEGGYLTRMRRSETRTDGPPEMTRRLGSTGQVVPWTEIVLIGEDDQPVAPGEVGEVCTRNLRFYEYWKDPEATRAAFWGDRFVRTGDMGQFDERGYLYLVDRKKDMIISGGENIFCREVENAIDEHPVVQTVSVIGQPDEKWGESVLAVIITRPGEGVTADEIIAFARERLAGYKCPKRVEFVEALPMTGANKIDKVALRMQFAKQTV